MTVVYFSPAAEADLEEIGDYIFVESPAAAARLISQITERCDRLAEQPLIGVKRPELAANLRSIVVYPYIVYYNATADRSEVRIERILHGARDQRSAFTDDERWQH